MGKINRVLYQEIEPEKCDIFDAGEYYFHHNVLGLHESFTAPYEQYEERQMKVRNSAVGDALKELAEVVHPIMTTAVFGVSSIKNQVVILADV